MRAVVVRTHGGPEQLSLEDWPMPEPGPNQALIEVKACGLNYLDIFVCRGMPDLPIKLPRIGGGDVAGIVRDVGQGVSPDWLGKRVVLFPRMPQGGILGEHANGGLCEFMTVDQSQLTLLPDSIAFTTAAALPIAYGTAHRMLVTKAAIKPGERILILGASGGVGAASVQLAKMQRAEVFACTSTDEKAEKLKELGADHVINYSHDDFSRKAWELSGRRGMDVAINFTGGDTWIPMLKTMAREGRILTCGSTAGHECKIDIRYLWHREISIIGSRAYMPSDLMSVVEKTAMGQLRPVIDRIIPLARAAEALAMVESRSHFGKVVITHE